MAISLDLGIKALAEAVATKINDLKAKIGDVTALTTTNKTSLVLALNEVKSLAAAAGAGAAISDGTTTGTTTWSSTQVQAKINAAIASLVNGAPGALDQINELATALGNDANFATTIANALALRLRVDIAQTLTAAQKLQGGNNLGVGDVTRDFVADFTAALT